MPRGVDPRADTAETEAGDRDASAVDGVARLDGVQKRHDRGVVRGAFPSVAQRFRRDDDGAEWLECGLDQLIEEAHRRAIRIPGKVQGEHQGNRIRRRVPFWYGDDVTDVRLSG